MWDWLRNVYSLGTRLNSAGILHIPGVPFNLSSPPALALHLPSSDIFQSALAQTCKASSRFTDVEFITPWSSPQQKYDIMKGSFVVSCFLSAVCPCRISRDKCCAWGTPPLPGQTRQKCIFPKGKSFGRLEGRDTILGIIFLQTFSLRKSFSSILGQGLRVFNWKDLVWRFWS